MNSSLSACLYDSANEVIVWLNCSPLCICRLWRSTARRHCFNWRRSQAKQTANNRNWVFFVSFQCLGLNLCFNGCNSISVTWCVELCKSVKCVHWSCNYCLPVRLLPTSNRLVTFFWLVHNFSPSQCLTTGLQLGGRRQGHWLWSPQSQGSRN